MKNLSFFLLALTASVAHASHHFNGFYASAAGGGIWLDTNIGQTIALGDPANFTVTLPSKINIEGGGTTGYLGVGYTHQFPHQITLGAEVTAGFTNASVTHRSEAILGSLGVVISGKVEVQQKNDFAILFKPGYVIKKHTHLYALVGPRWGNFDNHLSTVVSFVGDSRSTKENESGYQLGITAGVGIEHMLTNNLSLGLEYAYTSYGSLESMQTVGTADFGSPVPVIDTADIDASTNTLVAQLSYHF